MSKLLILALILTDGAVNLPPDLATQVDAMVQNAEGADLPGERLIVKAQEGAAKGVPTERIVAVLTLMRQHMDQAAALLAKQHLQPKQRRQLIGAVATGFEVGVPVEAVQTLVEAALVARHDPPALLGAVRALTDLVGHGYRSADVQELVHLAVENGFGERDFADLVRAVNELRGRGEPERALQAIYSMLRAGERPPFWVGAAGESAGRGAGTGFPGTDKGPSGLPAPYVPGRR